MKRTNIVIKDPKKPDKPLTYPTYRLEDFADMEFGTHIIRSGLLLHSHDFWEFSYVLKGTVKHSFNLDYTEILTPGYLIIFRPTDIHSFDDINEENSNHRDILFSRRLFKEICDFVNPELFEILNNSPVPISIPFSEEYQKNLEDILINFNSLDNSKSTIKYSIARSIGAYLLMLYNFHVCFKNEKYSKEFNRLLTILKTPSVLKKGIPELTKKIGYSHGHLCRLFKDFTGKTLLSCLTEYRMIYAAALIKNTEYTLLDIASRTGYESISHFTAVFRKFHGLPPHQYKSKLLQEKNNKLFSLPVPLNVSTKNKSYVTFGKFLHEKRINSPQKLSTSHMAEKMGLSLNFYENLERGAKLIVLHEKLEIFAKETELTPDDKKTLYRLADDTLQSIPSDIENFILSTDTGEIIRQALRETMSGKISIADWQKLIADTKSDK